MTASIAAGIFLGAELVGTKPDFQVERVPASAILVGSDYGLFVGGGEFKIRVKSLNGFTGIVSLSATAPSGVNATVHGYNNPNPVAVLGTNDTAYLRLHTSIAGNYTVVVTGTSGELSHSISFLLMAQDLTFTASPDPLVVMQGSRANSTITITSVNGLSGDLDVRVFSTSLDVVLFSTALNCSICNGPGVYPLPARGTVTAVMQLTWHHSGTASITLLVSVPGLFGNIGHIFPVVFI